MNTQTHKLLDEYFALGYNDNSKATADIKKRVKAYIRNEGKDRQLQELLLLMEFNDAMMKSNKFADHCYVVRPILDRLYQCDEWDLYDLRILSTSGLCIDDLDKIKFFLDKAINILDTTYINEPFYKRAKVMFYSNPTHTLIKMKCHYHDTKDSEKLSTINALIEKWIANTLEICGKDDSLIIPRTIATLRKGIYTEDSDLIEENLSLLSRHASKELYKIIENESLDYNYAIYGIISEKNFKIQVANNIRKYRKSAGYTLEQLSELADVPMEFLRQMETKGRSVTGFNLYKVANALKVPTDEIMGVYIDYDPEKNKIKFKLFRLLDPLPESLLSKLYDLIKDFIDRFK